MSHVDPKKLLRELQNLPTENEWVEFKENKGAPEDIGQYISALANTARIKAQPFGYMVWGIDDQTHRIVGTSFIPTKAKKGNEQLENWLVRLLTPRLDIRFYDLTVEEKQVVILEIPAALHTPVRFEGQKFIRVGSLTKKLKDYPEKERELWSILTASNFEQGTAK